MGAFDKFLDFMKIDNDDEYFENDYYEEESSETKAVVKDNQESEDRVVRKPKVSPINGRGGKKGMPSGMEVVRIEPSSVEDGRKISDLLLENKVVFLDLEGIDMNLAQRIIDFTSGATYAIDGTLQQMSKYTFVIAPPVVAVSGDFQDALSSNSSVTF